MGSLPSVLSGRQSIEPIAIHVSGKEHVRSMQRLVSEAVWDESTMLSTYHDMVAEEMGESDGVLMFDESGCVKKGTMSAGVARQYGGTIGKVENCHVVVGMGYASRQGSALVEARLFFQRPGVRNRLPHTVVPVVRQRI